MEESILGRLSSFMKYEMACFFDKSHMRYKYRDFPSVVKRLENILHFLGVPMKWNHKQYTYDVYTFFGTLRYAAKAELSTQKKKISNIIQF